VQRALELTAEYARERKRFGHAIGAFQAVRQRLAMPTSMSKPSG
jgi:alkylation response protein AidB-like acyl-CoA dehydrogenase